MGEIFTPRNDTQVEGIKFMISHSFGGLFWDPGVGKTPVTLQAFKILRDEGLARRMLVISSQNILNDVWPEQIEKFDDLDMTYAPMLNSKKKRMAGWEMDADVYLLNYEGLPWLRSTFKLKHGFDMLVVDESSKFRNRKAKTLFGTIKWLTQSFSRRYILTGTPIPKGYLNLWPQMYLVDMGESLGSTFTGYKNRFFVPSGYKGYDLKLRPGADKEIQRAIKKRVHRAEKNLSVDIEFIDHVVRLPPKAMNFYKELEREFISEWRGKRIIAQNAAVATGKLRQAANGAMYYGDKEDNPKTRNGRRFFVLHDRKVIALSNLIDSLRLRGYSLLVGYEFMHDHECMLRAGLDIPSYSRAKSGVERTALKKAWTSKEINELSSQIGAMSHGMNMQDGGFNLAYFGLTFNLEDYEQFYQRLWRDNQKFNVRAHRIVAEGTIDEVELKVLKDRGTDQKALLDAVHDHYKL